MTPTTIVKTYGRDAFLFWWNPIVAAVMSSAGMRVGVFSAAELVDRMERDALEMRSRGYRVASSEEVSVPLLFPSGKTTNYYRVTYERLDAPVAGKPSVG